ncbi:MAG TPA: ABC transporter ATP-binding protein [candidate division WOR-3 bacterium]|uniref:ABC transporter ATP-binding protein n=1 Tax=candidate division WOR-3 bacterium TaxID=2052148 RepID=A0A7V0XGD4_UNCW3|nr:ABC transporter ATP-binding protein [candidate division WOR-3 bacterium]
MSAACEVSGLGRDYGRHRALDDVSFTVAPGEVFGLIGPNGSGKTTTLRIVATLLRPTRGRALVFGQDSYQEARAVRRLISYLPEDAGAYKGLTGRQYLEFMATFYEGEGSAGQAGRSRVEIVARAEEICGLGERLKSKVKTYSKGMTRKLLLARALATGPRLAILDEPTSGLDVASSIDVRNRVREYARQGTSFLISSHNMLEVEFLCDRVVLLFDGRVVEQGTPAGLKEKYACPNLEEVFLRVTR